MISADVLREGEVGQIDVEANRQRLRALDEGLKIRAGEIHEDVGVENFVWEVGKEFLERHVNNFGGF